MCFKTHQMAQLTRNLGSMPIPLNMVCAVAHYLLFLYKKLLELLFSLQTFSKNILQTHQTAQFFKIFSWEHAPNPLKKCHAKKYPHSSKNILNALCAF